MRMIVDAKSGQHLSSWPTPPIQNFVRWSQIAELFVKAEMINPGDRITRLEILDDGIYLHIDSPPANPSVEMKDHR